MSSFFLADLPNESEEDPGILENIEHALGELGHNTFTNSYEVFK